jgi:hypothetical protein
MAQRRMWCCVSNKDVLKYASSAGVAKLVDALRSGRSGGNPMEVQFLSPALEKNVVELCSAFVFSSAGEARCLCILREDLKPHSMC